MADWPTEFDDLPVLAAVGAQIDRAAHRDEQRPRGWLSRLSRHTRIGAIAVVGLVCGSAALAANQLIRVGAPVPTSHGFAGLRSSLGEMVPGSSRLLSLRVDDPGDGPPWGLRVFRAKSGLACTQAGRVVDGALGVLGQDGAFHDDHRFHPLPVIADGCTGMDANGQVLSSGGSNAQVASGLVFSGGIPGARGCETATDRSDRVDDVASLEASLAAQERRHETALARIQRRVIARYERRARERIPLCPARDLRDVLYGFAGSAATKVTLTENGTTTRVKPIAADSGAYMFVLAGPFVQHRGVVVRRFYPHGVVCADRDVPTAPVAPSTAGCFPPPGFTGKPARLRLPALPHGFVPPSSPPPGPLHVHVEVIGLTIRFRPPHPGHLYSVLVRCAATSSSPALQMDEHLPTRLDGGHVATLRLHAPLPRFCAPAGHHITGEVLDGTNGGQIATFELVAPGGHG